MYKTEADSSHTLMSLSSDDHIVTGSTERNKDAYYKFLSSRYYTKRLVFPTKFLGWHITKLEGGIIGVSQSLLLEKLLQELQWKNKAR